MFESRSLLLHLFLTYSQAILFTTNHLKVKNNCFLISIQGNEKKDLILKVEHLADTMKFHRFIVSGKNSSIILAKNLDFPLAEIWRVEQGREPRTESGKLHLQNIYDALDLHLRNRKRKL